MNGPQNHLKILMYLISEGEKHGSTNKLFCKLKAEISFDLFCTYFE